MKVGIVHPQLLRGGGERVAKAICDAFTNCEFISYENKLDVKNVRLLTLPFKMPFGRKAKQTLILYDLARKINLLRREYDLLITTGVDLPLNTDIIYWQNPTDLNLFYIRHSLKFFYDALFYTFLVNNKFVHGSPKLIIYNSLYTKIHVEKALKINSKNTVVYPPFSSYSPKGSHDKDYVVTISRLDYNKNLQVIPFISSKLQDAKFFIFGYTQENTPILLREIHKNAKRFNVSLNVCNGLCDDANINIIQNASKEEIQKILSQAKVYFHPPFREPFGLAVLEGMSADLTPVVYKDSGSYYDIVKRTYGFAYEKNVEAVEKIRYALNKYERGVHEYTKLFNDENKFKQKIKDVIDTAFAIKESLALRRK